MIQYSSEEERAVEYLKQELDKAIEDREILQNKIWSNLYCFRCGQRLSWD